jgi:hypothetical protein
VAIRAVRRQHPLQAIGVLGALDRHQSDLAQMPAQRIEQRCALTDELLANPMAHHRGLVVDRTPSDEPLPGAHHRLADRRCVGRIRLIAPYVRLHMRRRDQFHLVTQRHELADPMMRRTASLHRHHAGREQPKNSNIVPRAMTTSPFTSTPCTSKTVFARSSPIRVTRAKFSVALPMDGFPSGGVHDNDHLGTLDAVGPLSTPSASLANCPQLGSAVWRCRTPYRTREVSRA